MNWSIWKGSDTEWDAIVSSFEYAQFAQSSVWKDFQKSLGRDVVRITNGQAACQLAHIKKMFGSYWLAQRGPVGGVCSEEMKTLLPENAWFVRVEPDQNPSSMFLRRPAHDPSVTRLLDLSPSEEVLLDQMHPKTRYNIKVAEKHGITIRESDSIDTFLLLQRDTARRDRFMAQSDSYIRKQFDILKRAGMATLLVAESDGTPLAANFMLTFGDTATYLYGASSSTHRNLMAPYLLHWQAIRWAKAQGLRRYDFWGCNPESKEHPDYKKSWDGISRFKAGWGGKLVELPGTFDLPLRPTLYNFGRAIRKI